MNAEHQHDTTGIICTHVLLGDRKLSYIVHEPDGMWQFLYGEKNDHFSADQAKVTCVGCAFHNHIKGLEIDDVPIGYVAERPNSDSRWVVRPAAEEELTDGEETQ